MPIVMSLPDEVLDNLANSAAFTKTCLMLSSRVLPAQ